MVNTAIPTFKKILIYNTAFIGDIILTTPLIRETAKLFPHAEIHFMTIPGSKNLVENNPHLSRLWIYDKRGKDRGIRLFLRLSKEMRQQQFDLAIVPHRSFRSASLVTLAKIPQRIGFDRSVAAYFFTHRQFYRRDLHEIDRNLSLLEIFNYHNKGLSLPEIFPDKHDKEVVNEWLHQSGVEKGKRIIVLAPGSIWPTKRWPGKYWGRLAKLYDQKRYTVVLIGSQADRFLLQDINSAAGYQVKQAMGIFTLRQTAELISRAHLLISNDSAPTHIGSAMRITTITIFGPTIPQFGFSPVGGKVLSIGISGLECRPCAIHGGHKCPKKHFKCMLELKPEIIFHQAQGMLNETN